MRLRGYARFEAASNEFYHHSRLVDGSLVIGDIEGARTDLEHMARALEHTRSAFHAIPEGDEITLLEDLRMRGVYAYFERRIGELEKPL